MPRTLMACAFVELWQPPPTTITSSMPTGAGTEMLVSACPGSRCWSARRRAPASQAGPPHHRATRCALGQEALDDAKFFGYRYRYRYRACVRGDHAQLAPTRQVDGGIGGCTGLAGRGKAEAERRRHVRGLSYEFHVTFPGKSELNHYGPHRRRHRRDAAGSMPIDAAPLVRRPAPARTSAHGRGCKKTDADFLSTRKGKTSPRGNFHTDGSV